MDRVKFWGEPSHIRYEQHGGHQLVADNHNICLSSLRVQVRGKHWQNTPEVNETTEMCPRSWTIWL